MVFGVPLAFGLLTAALVLVVWRLRPSGPLMLPDTSDRTASRGRLGTLGVVFAIIIALWLSEPLHGVRAWIVALGAAAAVFATRLIGWRDVLRMDWATLALI